MMENQNQSPEANKTSNQKWIVLGVGGGCALIACIVVVAALVVADLGPGIGKTFSSISVNPNVSAQVTVTPEVNNTPQSQLSTMVMPPARDHPHADGNKIGDPNAPVKMTEFGDFQCTYCQKYWTDTETQIIDSYVKTGKVQ